MGSPFLAGDEAVSEDLIAVFGEKGLGAGIEGDGPQPALVPLHRVFLAAGDEDQAFAPLGPVFNRKTCFHDVICLNRDKFSKFLFIFER